MSREQKKETASEVQRVRPGQLHQVIFTGYDTKGLATGSGPVQLEIRAEGGIQGEKAEVRIQHLSQHRPVAWGIIATLLEPSAHRTRPHDAKTHRCGGCNWSHMDYEAQLAAKTERLRKLLSTVTPTGRADIAEAEVMPSPSERGYRNRGKYVIARHRNRIVLGAYRPRSHEVERTIGCPVMQPDVDRAAHALEKALDSAGWPLFDPRTGRGLLRYASVRANHRDEILVTVVTAAEGDVDWTNLAEDVRSQCPGLEGFTIDINPDPGNVVFSGLHRTIRGEAEIEEQYGPVTVYLSGHGFGQANREQAGRLYRFAAEAAVSPFPETGDPPSRLLELFCGAGALSLTVARHGRNDRFHLTGIERDGEAVQLATRAAKDAGLAEKCTFFAADANRTLEKMQRGDQPPPQVVLLNPPRTGLRPELREALQKLQPSRMVYVSCSPETLTRDLLDLLKGPCRLTALKGFDMLPMTPHLELVAVLEAG